MKNNNIPVYFFLKQKKTQTCLPCSLITSRPKESCETPALLSSCSWSNNTEETRCHILQAHRAARLFLSQTQRRTPVPRRPQSPSMQMAAWDHLNRAPLQNPWAKAASNGVQWHAGVICRRAAKGCRAALPEMLRLPLTQRESTRKGRASPALMLHIQLHFFVVTPLIATLKFWQHYLKVKDCWHFPEHKENHREVKLLKEKHL